jgi:SAM-dependent methyltransferase
MPDRDWWAALWPDPEGTLRALGITPDMTVLDLCCGDGWFTAPLALLTGGKVFALDLDPAMLEAARTESDRTGATVLGWIEGDARDAATLLPQRVDYVRRRLRHCNHRAVSPSSTGTQTRARRPRSSASRAARRRSCA